MTPEQRARQQIDLSRRFQRPNSGRIQPLHLLTSRAGLKSAK
jgi:hypothetical protein